MLKIFSSRVGNGSGKPGTVLRAERGYFEIACHTGSLLLQTLQLAGKKRLDCASFLAGFPVAEGTLLGTGPSGGSPL
jgi:methionyl-tRNA formyltransferase